MVKKNKPGVYIGRQICKIMTKQPRIVVGGLVGFTTGMWWEQDAPSDDDIDADNDGVMDPSLHFNIDLSRVAARAIGYQASMMSGYKLHSVKVGIRPVDDISDNDSATQFAGIIDMYPFTDHARKALSLARKVEKADESSQVDGDSLFLTTGQDYSGFRYGWNASNDDHVFATNNSIPGMHTQWVLSEIFDAYDYATEPVQTNAMFGGRAPEQMSIGWSCGFNSLGTSSVQHGMTAHDSVTKCNLMVLPILKGQVKWSSTDETGIVDDDYRLWVEIEFTPEAGGVF